MSNPVSHSVSNPGQEAFMSWTDRPLTVLGLSLSGTAVAEYALSKGARVFLSEMLPATPTNQPIRDRLQDLGCQVETGGHSGAVYTHATQVVVSPGIPPSSQVIRQLLMSGVEVISEVELAYRENRQQAEPAALIGITGTNGKTTTTTLLAQMLSDAEQHAMACGNIGLPLISCLLAHQEQAESQPPVWVAEFSSYQLAFSPTLTADIAIFMNLTPDHLSWHGSYQAYQDAKSSLFIGERSPQWVVLNAHDPVSHEIAAHTRAEVVWFSLQTPGAAHDIPSNAAHWIRLDANGEIRFALEKCQLPEQTLMNVCELQLLGAHNIDNVMAAAAAALLRGVAPEQIAQTCQQFRGVAHRLEHVATVTRRDGVPIAFYNDSKATNTQACMSALRAFGEQSVILLAGGREKGEPLEPWAEAVKASASTVIVYGEAAEHFQEVLVAGGLESVYRVDSLETATEKAFELSTGQPVLLSPACASFDQYKNFEERGRVFTELVYNIKERSDV